MEFEVKNSFHSTNEQIIAALVNKFGPEIELSIEELCDIQGVVFYFQNGKLILKAN